jgi:hypothetical protein
VAHSVTPDLSSHRKTRGQGQATPLSARASAATCRKVRDAGSLVRRRLYRTGRDCEVRGQIVQVDCKNIDIWKQHPTAVFDVAWVPGRFSIRARWLLTSWNLPDGE